MTTFNNVEIEGFRDNLVNTPQVMKSRLLPGVTADLGDTEPGQGFSTDIELGGEGPKDSNTKGATIPYSESGQRRRYAFYRPIEDYFHTQASQVKRLITDPTTRKMADFMAKKEQKRDTDIYQGLLGPAIETDNEGAPVATVAFPNTQVIAAGSRDNLHDTEKSVVAASGNLGLTIGKLITAHGMLEKSEVMGEKYLALSTEMINQLLATQAGTSADYRGQLMALMSGKIDEFLGFKVLRFEKLTVASSIVDVVAWCKSAVEYRERPLVNVDISVRKDIKGLPTQFYYQIDRGVLRVHDTGVVNIKAHISRQ